MKDQLISLETAKLAKEKGFNELTCRCGGYPNCICNDLKPTQSLLQKWLREEYKKSVHVFLGDNFKYGYYIHDLSSRDIFEESRNRIYHKADYSNYESALEQGLKEALKLIP